MNLLEKWEMSKSHIKQLLLSEQSMGLTLEEIIILSEAALSDLKSTFMSLSAQESIVPAREIKPGPDQTAQDTQ